MEEVNRTFLTTWIMDCSLWPLVNFVGFAFVPVKILPTYMAGVSFFWQLYLSSVAASSPNLSDDDESKNSSAVKDVDRTTAVLDKRVSSYQKPTVDDPHSKRSDANKYRVSEKELRKIFDAIDLDRVKFFICMIEKLLLMCPLLIVLAFIYPNNRMDT